MLNLQIPFLYRFEDQSKGPVHINTMEIIEIKNYVNNSNWSTIILRNTEEFTSMMSPEEFVADILNSYNRTMETYKWKKQRE